MENLINLPWQSQVVIIGGYVGYSIAFAGRRNSHGLFDRVAISLCFGGPSLLVLTALEANNDDNTKFDLVLISILAIFASIFSAVLWRSKLRQWTKFALKIIGGGEDDNLPSAWDTLIQEQDLNYSQVHVTLKDGRMLESYQMERFNGHPNGACILGADGSLAIYVTHIEEPNQKRRKVNAVIDNDGARITYIPSDAIAEVDFRRKFRT